MPHGEIDAVAARMSLAYSAMRMQQQCFGACKMHALEIQALYESSLAFGLRKVLQSEEGKDELAARGTAAEAQAAELREQARAHACACAHVAHLIYLRASARRMCLGVGLLR